MGINLRLVKVFFIVLLALFAVITLFSLIIPSKIKVSRIVVINGHSKTDILDQLSNLQHWKNWQPLFKSNNAKIIYSDNQKQCTILQNGQETILEITSVDTSSIAFTLKEKSSPTINNKIEVHSIPVDNSIQVEWEAITKLKWYPWEKFYAIFMDKLTGPGYENSLNGLKEFIEKSTTTPFE